MPGDIILLGQADAAILAEMRRRLNQSPERHGESWQNLFPDLGLIAVSNMSGTDCPAGGLGFLTGAWGNDNQHLAMTIPPYPAISVELVVAATAVPADGDGLAWLMDSRAHPIYDPAGIWVFGTRIGAQGNSWAPMVFGLGPISITAAAVNGLAQGQCHGSQGDGIFVVDLAGVNTGFYDAILEGAEITHAAGSVPGDFSGLQ
jgi:hypothetical protein